MPSTAVKVLSGFTPSTRHAPLAEGADGSAGPDWRGAPPRPRKMPAEGIPAGEGLSKAAGATPAAEVEALVTSGQGKPDSLIRLPRAPIPPSPRRRAGEARAPCL
eukprot:scaffold5856_cov115-Isochrysis_galbana.AAC.3